MSETIDAEKLAQMVRAMRYPCMECKAGTGDPCREKSGPMIVRPGIPREIHKSRLRNSEDKDRADRKAAMRQPIDAWLADHNARFVFTATPMDSAETRVECYRVGGALLLVMHYPRGGWDVFTALGSDDIPTVLTDALMRISAPALPAKL